MTVCTQRGLKCLCLTDSSSHANAGLPGAIRPAAMRCLSATTQRIRSAGGKALPTTVVQIYQRAHGKRNHELPVMARTRGVDDGDGGLGGCYGGGERVTLADSAALIRRGRFILGMEGAAGFPRALSCIGPCGRAVGCQQVLTGLWGSSEGEVESQVSREDA